MSRREFLSLTAGDAMPKKPAKKQLKYWQCQNGPPASVAWKGTEV